MSFLSILKTIGSGFKLGATKALAIEAKALPAEKEIAEGIALVNPAAGATLLGLLTVVGQVEQVATAVGASSGTGPQKLAVAVPQIEQIILADPIFKGKSVANLDKYNKALNSLTSGLADLADSFSSGVAAPAPAAPAPAAAPAAPAAPAVPVANVPLVVQVPKLG